MGLCHSKHSLAATPPKEPSTPLPSVPVTNRPASLNLRVQPLEGTHEAIATHIYDGDTFTCLIDTVQGPLSINVRVLGVNSEEIKDKRYTQLKTQQPNSPLEEALHTWFFNSTKRAKQVIHWASLAPHVASLDPLWFERIAAIVSKYAVAEIFTLSQCKLSLDIPNMRPSFERILAHVSFYRSNQLVPLDKWMIERGYGYEYTTKAQSEKRNYTQQEKTRIFLEFAKYMHKYQVTLKKITLPLVQ